MRVLLITSDAYGSNGGIALYNRDLVQALCALPDVEEIVIIARVVQFAPLGIPTRVRFHCEATRGKPAFVAAALAVGHEHFDLIICGHINLLPVAAMLRWRQKSPLVLLAYGVDVWKPTYWLNRRLMACVDAVWAISAITRDRMNSWSKLSDHRYYLLPNAIHLERYGLAPRRADLIERFGLVGRKVLLTLGRLSAADRYKGIDEVLEVMPTLLGRQPDLTYLIAGDGDDRARLEAKARDLGVSSHVVFTGFVQENDKADMFRLADVFVMPGRGEGFGFVFLEAMACGVPVVASRLDGSLEAVLSGSLGRAVNPDDPENIVEAICEALTESRHIPDGLAYFAFPRFVDRVDAAVRTSIQLSSKLRKRRMG